MSQVTAARSVQKYSGIGRNQAMLLVLSNVDNTDDETEAVRVGEFTTGTSP